MACSSLAETQFSAALLLVRHVVRLEGSVVASCTDDVKINLSGIRLVRTVNTDVFVTVLTTVAEFSPAVLRTNRRARKNLRVGFKNVFTL